MLAEPGKGCFLDSGWRWSNRSCKLTRGGLRPFSLHWWHSPLYAVNREEVGEISCEGFMFMGKVLGHVSFYFCLLRYRLQSDIPSNALGGQDGVHQLLYMSLSRGYGTPLLSIHDVLINAAL